MKYLDGQAVMLGDKVDLGGGMSGVVVAVIDEDQFATGYAKADWGVLIRGALVNSGEAGLVHYEEASEDFLLVERSVK